MRPDVNKTKSFVLFAVLFLSIVSLSFSVLTIFSPGPSITAIRQCQDTLVRARQAEANLYVPSLYDSAQHAWQLAFAEWQRQNDKIFFRTFTRTDSLIRIANALALASVKQANAKKDSLAANTTIRLAFLKKTVAGIKTDMDRLSLQSVNWENFARGEILLLTAEEAFRRQEYAEAIGRIAQGEKLLLQVSRTAQEKLEKYMSNLPKWQEWTRATIEKSRTQGTIAVIVEKLRARCLLYSSGRLIKEFPAEFGPEKIGHKQQKGDGTTPEGQYFIIRKKSDGSTRYYKALEIDYPNEQDKRLFQEAKSNGSLPQNAQIGGLIEIHGEGGKGVNWTKGCVALANDDMDQLFHLVQIGTPVTIVGMMQSQ